MPRSRLLLAALLLLAVQQGIHAQDTNNGQGKIVWAIGQWLSGNPAAPQLTALGWTDGGNPCNGWQGVSCNGEGFVTNINLNGRGLFGTIPSDPGLWAGLTGLTNIDLANNQLTGTVPAAVKSAPLLNNMNLGENARLCGYLPTGLQAYTGGTNIGAECSTTAAPFPQPSPSPSPTPSPVASPSPSPAPPSPKPMEMPIKPVLPAPPAPTVAPTQISSAPICSCALQGFGSQDCTGALAKECRAANAPAVCNSTASVLTDATAATAMGQYLAEACFQGQNMDTSICTCVQNLLGNDCAKARVSLCVKGDALCLPIQNVVGNGGSSAAEDAQQVAAALDAQCAVTEPTQQGVKATMEFPDLSVGQYILKQYTQNVANALSSVTNVPTSSISTLDVRPFTGAARAVNPKRLLLQAAGNGVQATYFLTTEDPMVVSQRLSNAANDGTLSSRLAQYGITAQAGGLRVQNYLQAPAPTPAAKASSFPMWALAPIIVGGLLLLAAAALLTWCCCCRKGGNTRKAAKGTPAAAATAPKKGRSGKAGSRKGQADDDRSASRDMPSKSYNGDYVPAGKGAANGYNSNDSYEKAGAPIYKVPPHVPAPTVYDSSYSTYNNNGYHATPAITAKVNLKSPSAGAGMAAGAAAVAGTAAVAAGMKHSGSNSTRVVVRPESPVSSKGSGSNIAPGGMAAGSEGAAAPAGSGLSLATLQSLKNVRAEDAMHRTGSGGSNTLTPWEAAAARPAGAGASSLQGSKGRDTGAAAHPAAAGVTGGSTRSVGSAGPAAAAGVGAAAGLTGARSGGLAPAGSSEGSGQGNGAWRSNVRTASGQMPGTGGPAGSSMLAHPAGKSVQQAERAKFWAQFQETWQQVRQTQNVDHEPGSPSSGTNWTDITDARTFRHT